MSIKFSEDLQPAEGFEAPEEECAFVRAVIAGLKDLDSGQEISLEQARARLSL